MALFSKSGNVWHPNRNAALDLHEQLPAGNYTVKVDPITRQYFLEEIDAFTLPDRIYGDIQRQANRIIRSFADREGTTGVLLAGEKGSGKTLLSKHVCASLRRVGVPTLVINQAHVGDNFNAFIQTIEQPCVILFDEFEKNFKREEQEQLLTLLDGVFSSKKLFLLTCNDPYRVDQHMKNRPGRIYYFLKFGGLTENFIEEYCHENLSNTEYVEKVVLVSKLFGQFNFDMLQSLVEEMNRFDESPQEALVMLNAKPETDEGSKFSVQVIHDGVLYEGRDIEDGAHFFGNPLAGDGVDVAFYVREAQDAEHREDGERPMRPREFLTFDFKPEDFVRFDPEREAFTFQQGETFCILQRSRAQLRTSLLAF